MKDTGVIRIPSFDLYAYDLQIDGEPWLKDIYYKVNSFEFGFFFVFAFS